MFYRAVLLLALTSQIFFGCSGDQQAIKLGQEQPTASRLTKVEEEPVSLRFALIKASSDHEAFDSLQNLLAGLRDMGYYALNHFSLPLANFDMLSQALFENSNLATESGKQLVFSRERYVDLIEYPNSLQAFLQECAFERPEIDALLILGEKTSFTTLNFSKLPPVFWANRKTHQEIYNDYLMRDMPSLVSELKQTFKLQSIAVLSPKPNHDELKPEHLLKGSAVFDSDAYLLLEPETWLPNAKILTQVLLAAKKPVFVVNHYDLLFFGAGISITKGKKEKANILFAGTLLDNLGIKNEQYQASFSSDRQWRFALNLNNLRRSGLKTPVSFILAAENVIGLRETLE